MAVPGTQGRQAAEVLSGWWKPSGHNSHAAAFWLAVNCPATHTTHDWSVPFRRVPALHAEHSWRPASAANSPGLHGLHAGLAAVSAYLPGAHDSHAAAPGSEVWPNVHASHEV